MKDRNFVAWMLICSALLFFWMSYRQRQFQEEQRKKLEAEAIARETEADASKRPSQATEPEPNEEQAVRFEAEPTYITLGTYDPNDKYHLFLVLTSKGAGIDRIELVEQPKPGQYRYRSLESRGGYMGHLGLIEESGKVRIRSVPIGSPAQRAIAQTQGTENGLQPNDVIVELNKRPITTVQAWLEELNKIRPGATTDIAVDRAANKDDSPQRLLFTVTLGDAPLDIIRVVDDTFVEQVVGNILRSSCLTTLGKIDSVEIPPGKQSMRGLEKTLEGHWASRTLDIPGGMGVEFSLPLDGWLQEAGLSAKLELTKTYRLYSMAANSGNAGNNSGNVGKSPTGYDFDFEVAVRNKDTRAHSVVLRQEGFNGANLEGWWYSTKISQHFFSGAGARDVIFASENTGHILKTRSEIYSVTQSKPRDPDTILFSSTDPLPTRSLRYLGLDTQYFTTAFLPNPEMPDAMKDLGWAGARALCDTKQLPAAKAQAANIGFWFETSPVHLEPGATLTKSFRLFAGPKDPQILAPYGLSDSIEYGWFGTVATILSQVLHLFYGVVRNYGIAIVMLTVLVRGLMFPLGRRAALNAQKMQEIAPEIKRVNELYKDDFEKRTTATKEIYAKHNFKPLAGCLPVFIQIPIFLGLYRALSVDIELRQQPLIPGIEWCSNLAGPDMMADWSGWMPEFFAGRGSGWLGPYFNLLPLITITLFIVQQKMLMPKATDEQSRMQQSIMMYMTVFMGVMFFKVPSGLCIYFITSSIWSLIERNLVKRLSPPKLAGATADGGTAAIPAPPRPVSKARPVKPPEKLSDVLPWLKARARPVEEDISKSRPPQQRQRPKRPPKKR